jgi:hypothetical protein
MARLPGEALLPFFFNFVVFVFVSCSTTLIGFDLLAAGARAPRP